MGYSFRLAARVLLYASSHSQYNAYHGLCYTSRGAPRKHTVTYHFSDLQEVCSGNCQIHTNCQLQYLHPPQISTSGKFHCNNSSDNKSYWIHRVDVKISAQVTTVTYMHQSQPSLHLLHINLTMHLKLWPDNHLIWCNATCKTSVLNSDLAITWFGAMPPSEDDVGVIGLYGFPCYQIQGSLGRWWML